MTNYNERVYQASKIYYAKLLAAKHTVPINKTYDEVVREAYIEYKDVVKKGGIK